ncbi:MAG: hypothetical protein EA376_04780 [Phycisphaeraceae bacterium]|nr:MAG: hypothetical protein EA376_04780 [Phycisphaeraceae bacterium]
MESEAREALTSLRAGLATVLDAAGSRGSPPDIARSLRIHRKLAWQVSKVLYEPDPFLAARHVPSMGSMETLLRAAADKDVPESLLEEIRRSVAAYERLGEIHAGDRASLEMMLLSMAAHPDPQAHVAMRRSSFLGNSFLWGVQAKTELCAIFLHPSEIEGRFDFVRVKGLYNLRRNRPNIPWVISRLKYTDDEFRKVDRIVSEPLDDVVTDAGGVPLIRKFCSDPLPRFRRTRISSSEAEDQLTEGPAGDTAAVTIVSGEVIRNAFPTYREHANEIAEFGLMVRTPSEVLVFDLFVHRSLFQEAQRQLAVYGLIDGLDTRSPSKRLAVCERVERIGRGRDVVHSPEVPQYERLVGHVLDRLSWRDSEFDVFRVRMPYPPMPSGVFIWHELSEKEPVRDAS